MNEVNLKSAPKRQPDTVMLSVAALIVCLFLSSCAPNITDQGQITDDKHFGKAAIGLSVVFDGQLCDFQITHLVKANPKAGLMEANIAVIPGLHIRRMDPGLYYVSHITCGGNNLKIHNGGFSSLPNRAPLVTAYEGEVSDYGVIHVKTFNSGRENIFGKPIREGIVLHQVSDETRLSMLRKQYPSLQGQFVPRTLQFHRGGG